MTALRVKQAWDDDFREYYEQRHESAYYGDWQDEQGYDYDRPPVCNFGTLFESPAVADHVREWLEDDTELGAYELAVLRDSIELHALRHVDELTSEQLADVRRVADWLWYWCREQPVVHYI